MEKYLQFNDEASARQRNRELMDIGRDPTNAGGDGKPYATIYKHTMGVAEDGAAVLVVNDEKDLTVEEKAALLETRPTKFDPVEDDIRA